MISFYFFNSLLSGDFVDISYDAYTAEEQTIDMQFNRRLYETRRHIMDVNADDRDKSNAFKKLILSLRKAYLTYEIMVFLYKIENKSLLIRCSLNSMYMISSEHM